MSFKITGLCLLLLSFNSCKPVEEGASSWEDLFDKDLSNFEVFIGVPHTSLDLEGYEKGDGMEGTPIGLSDPLNVFTTGEENRELILQISGEVYGALTTKKEYENYRLKAEFKWGTAKFEPRLDKQRDNGILYHCTGEHGAFWNVWMRSNEFQVQEKDMGDYYGLAGGVAAIPAIMNSDSFWVYTSGAELIELGTVMVGKNRYRGVRNQNFEKSNGEWNTLEIICLGSKSIHIVNGRVVLVSPQSYNLIDGELVPNNKGKIQIQSEGAEAYYKNLQIKAIDAIPAEYVDQL